MPNVVLSLVPMWFTTVMMTKRDPGRNRSVLNSCGARLIVPELGGRLIPEIASRNRYWQDYAG
jgi:hypothetical protein